MHENKNNLKCDCVKLLCEVFEGNFKNPLHNLQRCWQGTVRQTTTETTLPMSTRAIIAELFLVEDYFLKIQYA